MLPVSPEVTCVGAGRGSSETAIESRCTRQRPPFFPNILGVENRANALALPTADYDNLVLYFGVALTQIQSLAPLF
ncbi:hypothetical protein GCM10012319_54650 [Comamonas sp. KCTC 72670]|nr:hypothetical protein GCM10012319_54650 [Comamonas sp. KCTC 72670]